MADYGFVKGDSLQNTQAWDENSAQFDGISTQLSEQATSIEEAATSEGTSYTPAVPADWASTPPTTVQEALDRIAAFNPGA